MTDWRAIESRVFMTTGRRLPVVLVRGEGSRVWDDDAALDRTVTIKPLPDMLLRQALSNMMLTHGHSHFGEICVLRVLQGLDSSVI